MLNVFIFQFLTPNNHIRFLQKKGLIVYVIFFTSYNLIRLTNQFLIFFKKK
jgi:hypothetical protein